MKKLYLLLLILLTLYIVICLLLYLNQERLIFFPEKLSKDYRFNFNQQVEEINISTPDNVLLNALLFKSETSKGVIFYLHGNAGSLKSWGDVAKTYTALNYDVFMMDYRGFGKSGGSINSEQELYQDVQMAYDIVKKRYTEAKIIVLGYSIGTGFAAKIASINKPALLILQAPYFSMVDMMKSTYPLIPVFILKYKLETNKYIKSCSMPIILFHGDADEVIDCHSSTRLIKIMKPSDTLITLHGQGHIGITDNEAYKLAIKGILSR